MHCWQLYFAVVNTSQLCKLAFSEVLFSNSKRKPTRQTCRLQLCLYTVNIKQHCKLASSVALLSSGKCEPACWTCFLGSSAFSLALWRGQSTKQFPTRGNRLYNATSASTDKKAKISFGQSFLQTVWASALFCIKHLSTVAEHSVNGILNENSATDILTQLKAWALKMANTT